MLVEDLLGLVRVQTRIRARLLLDKLIADLAVRLRCTAVNPLALLDSDSVPLIDVLVTVGRLS